MSTKINFDIPHTMTASGLEYLGRLASTVPENGIIVEVGPLFGSSTWVLSKNSHPSVTIYSIDTWEPQPWIDKIEAKFPGCKPFSKEAFEYYIQDCPNVIPVQGWSPNIAKALDLTEIDMFFDDATHGDPGFTDNMRYFIPKVKGSGIVCGDDYAAGWPDIVKNVDSLGVAWGAETEMCGRVWALQKPDGLLSRRLFPSLPLFENEIDLVLETKHTDGRLIRGVPRCWTGSTHKFNPITSIKFILIKETNLELIVSAKFSDGSIIKSDQMGGWLSAENNAELIDILIEIKDQVKEKYKVIYQACVNKHNSKKTINTKDSSSGGWVNKTNNRIHSLRVNIQKY